MELRHLTTFRMVANRLSFTQAAAALGEAALLKARSTYEKGAVVGQLARVFGAALAKGGMNSPGPGR